MAFTSFAFILYHPICDCHPGNIKPILPEKVSSAQVALPPFLILDTVEILTKVCQVIILLRVGVCVCAYSTDDLSFFMLCKGLDTTSTTRRLIKEKICFLSEPTTSDFTVKNGDHCSLVIAASAFCMCRRWPQYICADMCRR